MIIVASGRGGRYNCSPFHRRPCTTDRQRRRRLKPCRKPRHVTRTAVTAGRRRRRRCWSCLGGERRLGGASLAVGPAAAVECDATTRVESQIRREGRAAYCGGHTRGDAE